MVSKQINVNDSIHSIAYRSFGYSCVGTKLVCPRYNYIYLVFFFNTDL